MKICTGTSGAGMIVCTGTGGTGIRVVQNLPNRPIPAWIRTELTEVFGSSIDVITNFPKRPVPVLMSYRTYGSARYRY